MLGSSYVQRVAIDSEDIGLRAGYMDKNNHVWLKIFVVFTLSFFIKRVYSKSKQKTVSLRDKSSTHVTTHKRYKRKIKIVKDNWFLFLYRTLPLNFISRLWGNFNDLTLPMWFRPYGYRFYCYLYTVDVSEILDKNFYHYPNLGSFFYRNIDPKARPIVPGDNVITSPSDGTILNFGTIDPETGEIEQVKGLTYSIREFLGTHEHPLMTKSESHLDLLKQKWKQSQENSTHSFSNLLINEGDKSALVYETNNSKIQKLLSELTAMDTPSVYNHNNIQINHKNQLYFTVIYLGPGDYHHFHSPINWVCKIRRHFPGKLFSVAPYFQRHFKSLFVLNERVPLLGYWKYGFFSMTAVGATNVGSIKLNFDKDLRTNVKQPKSKECKHNKNSCYEAVYVNTNEKLKGVPLLKGEEMGGFKFGSTVVLCFEAPFDFKYNIKCGQKIKLGEKIGTVP
ncbi:hypothetical protein TPHA_0O01550 [Tetrapisispora phaffii CBS 4417]|uniref:Phosphatidylserine decarboxylase proenzyme 1, mitochondrial n=1 Tax=Tetrapisispora phaffii (strain ATCC 24235 / CBS 4417 / NBRC 1672 / NRRL Y-8282 / UCD 70-5) TaxID=1071381 RepID=G8C1U4_TETPH|nr:hypothetical protein TPHA_0O01550 [Tetrapisispora phaffii CBS 4417]CCE66122.1 hypothetical protein TPHA_0O01550 [Tetrapisispora phaffii CBS 4417]